VNNKEKKEKEDEKLREELKKAADSIPVRPKLGKIRQRTRRSPKDPGDRRRGDKS
jgi:hypothetical protein